jgi:CO dehydrogenase maturation factor
MKLAVSGKGGAGKSTIAAALALIMARRGKRVLALDADPDANLAATLGIPEEKRRRIVPISRQVDLIEKRTGAKVKQYGQIFKLNPEVSDIAGSYAIDHEGVALLVLGAVEQGGSGCACPENVLIRALVADLILDKDEALVMDMEAGIEHLGRATAKGVDAMLVVVEPGLTSIECARRIEKLSHEIGLGNVQFVANKINGPLDEQFISNAFPEGDLLAMIPYREAIRQNDWSGRSVLDGLDEKTISIFEDILNKLIQSPERGERRVARSERSELLE